MAAYSAPVTQVPMRNKQHPPFGSDALPFLRLPGASMPMGKHEGALHVPTVAECEALWDKYEMWDNIRAHSRRVGELAHAMAGHAEKQGEEISPQAVLAAGLLHDLGKTHSILHGGHHDQIGAAWVMRETRNGPISQAVLFHTFWPWEEKLDQAPLLVQLILYADKRVQHDQYVDLDSRFSDLVTRYGKSERALKNLAAAHAQGKAIETALSGRLGVKLDEYTAHSGRLVHRT